MLNSLEQMIWGMNEVDVIAEGASEAIDSPKLYSYDPGNYCFAQSA
jgi:hypothetical protein